MNTHQKKLITLVIAIAMISYACGNRPNQTQNIDISANIYETSKDLPRELTVQITKNGLSFPTKEVVVLDPAIVVGDIDKVQVVGDNIYVLDKRKAKALFCFSKKGKLKWTFKNKPYDKKFFVRLGDFHVRDEHVYLLDNLGGKVLELNSGGKFINEKKFNHIQDLYPESIFNDEKGNFIMFNSDMGDFDRFPYEVVVLDPECKKILSYHFQKTQNPSIKRWQSEVSPFQVTKSNSGFYYTRVLDDTIYYYNKGVFRKSYLVDFGKNKVPDRIRKKANFTIDTFLGTKYMSNIERVYETDSTISFTFYNGNTLSYNSFNKKTNSNTTVPMAFFQLDGYFHTMLPIGSGTDTYICKLDPSNLLQFLGSYKANNPKLNESQLMHKLGIEMPTLAKLKKEISATSNPILVFINN